MVRYRLLLAVAIAVLLGTVVSAGAQGQFIVNSCNDIPSSQRIAGATWCYEASTSLIKYWDGTTFISYPIGGGGGGGGTPGLPVRSTQINDAGVFTGAVPLHVTGTNGAAIQAAINATPDGGLLQLEAITYDVTDLCTPTCTTITINKALTIRGTNLGQAYLIDGVATTGSRINSGTNQIVFTVNTHKAVVFQDFSFGLGTGGTGILLTASVAANSMSVIERVAFYNGAIGITSPPGKSFQTRIRGNLFWGQTNSGVFLRGYQNGDTNCDGGGYTLTDNLFFGVSPSDTAMRFHNSAAVTLVNNQAISWVHVLQIDVGTVTSGACNGPGPTQWQVSGNQFESGGAGAAGTPPGEPILINAGYPFGIWEFNGNMVGTTNRLFTDAFRIIHTSDGNFGVNITNNNFVNVTASAIHISGGTPGGGYSGAVISGNSMTFGSTQFNFSGNTHSSTFIDGIAGTTYLAAGTSIVGSGIPVGAKVLNVNSPNSITLTVAATSTLTGVTLTANLTGNTHTSTTIDNILPNTSHLAPGMTIFGSGIPIGTRILTVNSSSQITLTASTTSTLTGTILTGNSPAINIENPGYGVIVTNNTVLNPVSHSALWAGSGYTLVSPYNRDGQDLANLPAAENGSLVWCQDCVTTSVVCAAGGTGTLARRQGGQWLCSETGTISAQLYGVLPSNGGATNSANIGAAVSAACGSTLYFPPGIYTFSSGIGITCPNGITIKGGGAGRTPSTEVGNANQGTTITASLPSSAVFSIDTQGSVQFQDIRINQSGTLPGSGCIFATNASGPVGNDGLTLSNVVCSGGDQGLFTFRAAHINIVNSRFEGFVAIGMAINSQQGCNPNSVQISNTEFVGGTPTGTALIGFAGDTSNLTITGSHFHNVTTAILSRVLNSDSPACVAPASPLTGITITGNTLVMDKTTSVGDGINIAALSNHIDTAVISGNTIVPSAGNACITITRGGTFNVRNLAITGNACGSTAANARAGIIIDHVIGGTITGNTWNRGATGTGAWLTSGGGNVRVTVSGTQYVQPVVATDFITAFDYALIQSAPILFANLKPNDNGSMVYCSDCAQATPCAGAGSGAYAAMIAGTWQCGGSGSGAVTSVTGTAGQITAVPTIGAVGLSLPNPLIVPGALTVTGLAGAGTRCVQTDAAGAVTATGSACGGSGSSPGAPVGGVQFNNTSALGGSVAPIYVKAFQGGATTRLAIQNAIDAAPSNGKVQLECGAAYTMDSTTILINKTVEIAGCGFAGAAIVNPGTVPISVTIDISASVLGPFIHGLFFQGGVTAIARASTSTDLGTVLLANYFVNQTTPIIMGGTGNSFQVRQSYFNNFTGSAITIPTSIGDSCECIIEGNTIVTGAAISAIEWQTGGNTRINNNKIMGTSYSNGALHFKNTVPTSELLIVNNVVSVDGGPYAIWFEQGTAAYHSIVMTGNQLNGNASTALVRIADTNIGNMTITGNQTHLTTGITFDIANLDRATIAGNTIQNDNPGGAGIRIRSGGNNIVIPAQQITNDIPIVVDAGATVPARVYGFSVPFAQLANINAGEGSEIWCTNCSKVATCTGGGSGAPARRFGAAWTCNWGGTVTGTGTTNKLPVWNSTTGLLGDSSVTQNGTTELYMGQGITAASPAGIWLYATGGSGPDNSGGNLTLNGGKSTGSAAGGSVYVNIAVPGSTGSGLNPTTSRWVFYAPSNGDLLAQIDGGVNVGAPGNNRPDKVYAKTSLNAPLVAATTVTATSVTASSITAGSTTFPVACQLQSHIPQGYPVYQGSAAGTSNVSPVGIGQLFCVRFQQVCQATGYTKIAFRIANGGAAGTQCQVGIYTSDGTSAVRLGSVKACDVSTTTQTDTALAGFNLDTGQGYMACFAASTTTTLNILGVVGPSAGIINTFNTLILNGPTGATAVAQFTAACTGASTPYACCGAAPPGTSTCTGMPASVGAFSANSTATTVPFIIVAP